jgi:hypothetical protein
MNEINTTKNLTIRECGHDEYWLRDIIFDDPSVLGLGDLQAVRKEKPLSQGGRLDLLLKDPEDESMYEVELQLDETDESHIIRTIEYWDNVKSQWPRRSHTAVLVAEKITNRFYKVVHLLSMAVPIIGIQAKIVEIDGKRGLNFTTILDTYEEPEEGEGSLPTYNEKHWADNYPGALECARWYREILQKYYGEIPTKYFETSISLTVGGIARVWICKRKNDRAFIEVKYVERDIVEAVDYLNKAGIAFSNSSNKYLKFNVNLQQLKDRQAAHDWVVKQLAPQYVIKAT